MAVKIRLARFGKKDYPTYRIAVADSRKWRDGQAIEYIGFYNPNTDPLTVELEEERYKYWISQGAQPSETVKSLAKRVSDS